MKQSLTLILLLIISSFDSLLFAQDAPVHPIVVQKPVYFDISPPIREVRGILTTKKEAGNGDKEIPNRIGKKEFPHLKSASFALPEDPVWQKQNGTNLSASAAPIQNFEGINNLSGVYPPDTQGDVSFGDYVQVVNLKFSVYSKVGALLLGPLDLSTIWTGIPAPWNGTNNGDPVVLYDQAANRWLITQFSLPASSTSQYAELIAVSATSDPTGSWYRYVFQYGTKMPDYPKFGVWPDGYYMSANQFTYSAQWNFVGVAATAFERTKMLAGDPTASMQYFDLGASSDPQSMLPSDWDGPVTPVPGEANHFTYFNDWTPGSSRYLNIWDFHVDWVNPANTTFTQVSSLETAPFDASFCGSDGSQCIPQPGTSVKLATLSDRLMYRLQYRNFGGYRAMVTNHTVDMNGADHSGIRWYELRNTGSGWSIYQQGSYAPDAAHRWMGSIAMNSLGDIALGYSISDPLSTPLVYPGIRYTGRKAADVLGVMTIPEQTIINGGGFQSGSVGRWGDYSMMSVDPSDDLTFWYTTEYIQTSGSAPWQTRIASFKFGNLPSPITLPAYAITTTSATLSGSVNPNSLATNYHFEYGTTVAYGSSTPTISAGSGVSAVPVSADLSSLFSGTPIHYRLVAVNSDGTSNGSDVIFTPGGVVLSTTTPTAITMVSATGGGNISSDGGSAVTARGVCWSTLVNPVVSGSHTTDGPGSGVFTSALTGLSGSTVYHVRAYATNGVNTFYGNDVTFTTICGIYGLPFYENFPIASNPTCWSQNDHQGNGQTWKFGMIVDYSTYNPVLTGNYAYLNSDGYLSGNSQNADLVSPLLDLSGYATVTLSFNHYFRYISPSSGTLFYSIDNGSTWVAIQSYTSSSANPATFSQTIPAVAGQSQVKFKWNYTGTWAWYWAIDDVQITGLLMNRQLSNIIVPFGTTNCFNAMQTITVAGSGTTFDVQDGGSATLIAGSSISILPGTTVHLNGYFSGYIAPSGPFCANPTFVANQGGNIIPDNHLESPATTAGSMFKVYPNPTTGMFTLEISGTDIPEKISVEIYGPRGEKILSQEVSGQKSREFSLSNTPAGLYFVRVYTGDKAETIKLVKY